MRTWVVLLALANAAFFVWTSGWFSPWLPAPWQSQREPQRLENQLNPERVAVRRPMAPDGAQVASASASASAPQTAAPSASTGSAAPGTAAAAPTAADSPAGGQPAAAGSPR